MRGVNTKEMKAAGVCPERLENAERALLHAIEEKITPGCVVAVSVRGKTVWKAGYGILSPEAETPVTPDTLYDLASLTKPLACASSLMRLVERGQVCLADELTRYFPRAERPHLKGVTLHHLLTHTSGLPAWARFYERSQSPAEVVDAALSTPLEATPGERCVYSDIGYILLGEVVHQATGQRLDEFARENVFRPLGMETMGFWSLEDGGKLFTALKKMNSKEAAGKIAPTRHCPLREGQTLCAEVHDGNGRAMNGVSGHAGLFGTADDVLRYLHMLLNNGRTEDGRAFFSPAALRLVTTPQIDPTRGGGRSIGWVVPPNGMHVGGDLWANRGFSHTGFTGTSAFADPEEGVAVVLLTNAVYYSTGEQIRLRRKFHNTVAASLVQEE